MGRILAFDYGTKRIGIAVTDPLQLIASGLKTVETSEILTFLEAYCTDEEVVLFVVGLPKQMNNLPSESEQFIKSFIRNLKRTFPEIPISLNFLSSHRNSRKFPKIWIFGISLFFWIFWDFYPWGPI